MTLHGSLKNSADLRDILVVAPSLHWHYSGVTSTIIALLPYQKEHISIAAIGPFIPPKIPKISFYQILKHCWSKPQNKSHRILHARRNNENITGFFLKYILRQPWKMVFTWAGQRKQSRLTRWFLRKMDAVIATSEAAQAYLEVPSNVIHHGVDTKRFHPANDKCSAWHETGLPGSFGIGVFGRIRPEKGSDLFVESMIKLLPKYPNATAIITGLVATEHQRFATHLKKQIIEAGLENRIIFLGEQTTDKMPFWFRCINLYVAPMRWEGFGLTPLEAMASGTAVVATKTGAAPKLVEDNITGILVEHNDLEALVNAIEPFLANPEKAKIMGDAGREKAITHHDINNEAVAIQMVYEKIWG